MSDRDVLLAYNLKEQNALRKLLHEVEVLRAQVSFHLLNAERNSVPVDDDNEDFFNATSNEPTRGSRTGALISRYRRHTREPFFQSYWRDVPEYPARKPKPSIEYHDLPLDTTTYRNQVQNRTDSALSNQGNIQHGKERESKRGIGRDSTARGPRGRGSSRARTNRAASLAGILLEGTSALSERGRRPMDESELFDDEFEDSQTRDIPPMVGLPMFSYSPEQSEIEALHNFQKALQTTFPTLLSNWCTFDPTAAQSLLNGALSGGVVSASTLGASLDITSGTATATGPITPMIFANTVAFWRGIAQTFGLEWSTSEAQFICSILLLYKQLRVHLYPNAATPLTPMMVPLLSSDMLPHMSPVPSPLLSPSPLENSPFARKAAGFWNHIASKLPRNNPNVSNISSQAQDHLNYNFSTFEYEESVGKYLYQEATAGDVFRAYRLCHAYYQSSSESTSSQALQTAAVFPQQYLATQPLSTDQALSTVLSGFQTTLAATPVSTLLSPGQSALSPALSLPMAASPSSSPTLTSDAHGGIATANGRDIKPHVASPFPPRSLSQLPLQTAGTTVPEHHMAHVLPPYASLTHLPTLSALASLSTLPALPPLQSLSEPVGIAESQNWTLEEDLLIAALSHSFSSLSNAKEITAHYLLRRFEKLNDWVQSRLISRHSAPNTVIANFGNTCGIGTNLENGLGAPEPNHANRSSESDAHPQSPLPRLEFPLQASHPLSLASATTPDGMAAPSSAIACLPPLGSLSALPSPSTIDAFETQVPAVDTSATTTSAAAPNMEFHTSPNTIRWTLVSQLLHSFKQSSTPQQQRHASTSSPSRATLPLPFPLHFLQTKPEMRQPRVTKKHWEHSLRVYLNPYLPLPSWSRGTKKKDAAAKTQTSTGARFFTIHPVQGTYTAPEKWTPQEDRHLLATLPPPPVPPTVCTVQNDGRASTVRGSFPPRVTLPDAAVSGNGRQSDSGAAVSTCGPALSPSAASSGDLHRHSHVEVEEEELYNTLEYFRWCMRPVHPIVEGTYLQSFESETEAGRMGDGGSPALSIPSIVPGSCYLPPGTRPIYVDRSDVESRGEDGTSHAEPLTHTIPIRYLFAIPRRTPFEVLARYITLYNLPYVPRVSPETPNQHDSYE